VTRTKAIDAGTGRVGRPRVPPDAARASLALLLALGLSACSPGKVPASPASAFRAELVGVAKSVDAQSCGVVRITLTSGDTLDLDLQGSALNYDTPCPDSTSEQAIRMFGRNEAEVAKDHLFFFAHDAEGKAYYGWASQGQCGMGTYAIFGGAFEDGSTFHLPSGLVLDKASTFDRGDVNEPAIVKTDGWVCVDSLGRVVSIDAPRYM
jgi:hypothetical protein